ncbi:MULTISPECIES: hydrogenase maturation factor [Burkholderia]|nr:hydrogenase maturation factor [Burkholderia sp. LMG 13014]
MSRLQRQSEHVEVPMNSTYDYHGYTIEVRCEVDTGLADARTQITSNGRGYVVIVQVRMSDTSALLFTPVRLAGDRGKPFAESLEAVRAGRAAGQIIVDDLLLSVSMCDRQSRN